jgi:hypothetical protein
MMERAKKHACGVLMPEKLFLKLAKRRTEYKWKLGTNDQAFNA